MARPRVESGFQSPYGWCRYNPKGYALLSNGPYKDQYLHRVHWEHIAGRPIRPGFVVHHQQGKCWCGWNLIEMPAEMNPSPGALTRCPFTGRFLGVEEMRRMGLGVPGAVLDQEVPF